MPEQLHRHALAPDQVRFAASGQTEGVFSGYAAVFNDLVPLYGERVLPGAFTRTLAALRAEGKKFAILAAHDSGRVIGLVDPANLIEDAHGLFMRDVEMVLETQDGAEQYALIKRGLVSLSIGFWPVKWTRNDAGEILIEDAELIEVSVVFAGASPRATITEIRQAGGNPMPEPVVPETPATPEQRAAAASNQAVTALEARMVEMETTIQELEARGQRPGVPAAPRNVNEQTEREMRAIVSFIRTGNDAEMRAASSTPDSDGGWFILPTVDRTIRNMMEDTSPLLGLVENVTISGDTYERFYSKGNRGAVWVSENDDRPEDTARPELIKHMYGVREMYAMPVGTRQLFDDASFDVAGWFNQWVASDFALSLGDAFWSGDGINGKPRGLLTHNIVNTGDATRAWGDIQYVPAGHASAPTDDNLAKALVALVLTLHSRFRGNARLLTTAANYIRFRQLQDTAKRFLWAATGNLVEDAENGSLLGVPVAIDDHLDDISVGAGANIAAVGDFAQAYVHVARQGIKTERDGVTKPGWIKLPSYARHGGGLGDSRAVKILKIAAS